MSEQKISIITASYNSAKTIAETIQSVLDQSYDNYEYIIIDGNSNDETVSIIKQFEPKFADKLIWSSEKDNGIYDAWNKGVKMSEGDWIMFVGSDDLLNKNALEIYAKAANENDNINFISSKCKLVTENLSLIRFYGQEWSEKMNEYCTIAHVGSLHHKSLFENIGEFSTRYKITGDYDFLLRCRNIIRPLFVPEITVIVRDGGISGRNIFRVSTERLKVKIVNGGRAKILCYYDYIITIIKFYVRKSIINPFTLRYVK